MKLNIIETRVTKKGARLALENLPNLTFFAFPSSFQVVAEMNNLLTGQETSEINKSSQQPSTGRQLGLRDLYMHQYPLSKEVVAATLQFCPFLNHVELDSVQCYFPDESFKALLNLENLQHLVLKCTHDITFNGGILPVLEKFGSKSLEMLSLVYLPDANIGDIVQHCPNLRTLNLREVENYIPADPSIFAHQHTLPRLENLCVEGYNDMPPSESQPKSIDLALLLRSSPALVRLHLRHLDNLNDQVLEQAFREHNFSNLEHLEIHYCPIVTGNGIDLIVSSENPLKKLEIFLCCLLERSWKTAWEKKARDNNWDLTMDIAVYDFRPLAAQNPVEEQEDIAEEDEAAGGGSDSESDGGINENMEDGDNDD